MSTTKERRIIQSLIRSDLTFTRRELVQIAAISLLINLSLLGGFMLAIYPAIAD